MMWFHPIHETHLRGLDTKNPSLKEKQYHKEHFKTARSQNKDPTHKLLTHRKRKEKKHVDSPLRAKFKAFTLQHTEGSFYKALLSTSRNYKKHWILNRITEIEQQPRLKKAVSGAHNQSKVN
jgi:hypothetical protein